MPSMHLSELVRFDTCRYLMHVHPFSFEGWARRLVRALFARDGHRHLPSDAVLELVSAARVYG
jgi:hypothetical protein